MLIVDTHTHLFPPEVKQRRETFCMMDDYFADLYGDEQARIATVEDLITEMDLSGVDVSVVCGFGWTGPELCTMHNDYLLDCLRRYPTRLVAMACVQPLSGQRAQAEMERCLAGGMKGAGELMPDGQGYRLNELHRITTFFEHATSSGFPVLTHTSEPAGHHYPGKGTVTPDTIWPLVQAFPDLKLILAHWGGGYPFYELMPEVHRASVNVYYDSAASTYLYSPEVFVEVGRIAGFDRILWASDYPVLRQGRFLQRVRDLPLSQAERDAVLGGNAARLFGLPS